MTDSQQPPTGDQHVGQDDFLEPDAVFPTVDETPGSVDVRIEQGRIRMRDEGRTHLSVGVANRGIESPATPASLHAGIDVDDDDEIYAEFAFDNLDGMRTLRDALTAAIDYREGTAEPEEETSSQAAAESSQHSSDPDQSVEEAVKTATNYPNPGVRVDLDVDCTDCHEENGDYGKSMSVVGFDSQVERGVVYQCDGCGKTVTLGRYGKSSIREHP